MSWTSQIQTKSLMNLSNPQSYDLRTSYSTRCRSLTNRPTHLTHFRHRFLKSSKNPANLAKRTTSQTIERSMNLTARNSMWTRCSQPKNWSGFHCRCC